VSGVAGSRAEDIEIGNTVLLIICTDDISTLNHYLLVPNNFSTL
jgi:hypothetical protein